MNNFYHRLVHIDDVVAKIDLYDISVDEREDLTNLVQQIFHNHTFHLILNHLPKNKHHEFLNKFASTPHDLALLEFIKKEIKIDIEEAIKNQSEKIKRELLAEIKKSHKK